MLRKKEKKAITSTIALLIGWPVGLDQFLEGQNSEGVKIIIGWLFVIISFIGAIAFNEPSVLIFSFLAGFVGIIGVFSKLVSKLKAFEEAED